MVKGLSWYMDDRLSSYYPDDFEENERSLRALDWLRIGEVETAFEIMEIDFEPPFEADTGLESMIHIVDYEDNSGKFKRQMRQLARDLRDKGY